MSPTRLPSVNLHDHRNGHRFCSNATLICLLLTILGVWFGGVVFALIRITGVPHVDGAAPAAPGAAAGDHATVAVAQAKT